ncbi:MAG: mechanosensitive ion channel protein MscS, partial [Methylibium sp.]|nr:mechanosensitive ion channel protein MscS [Methylibium sp.]
MEDWIRLVGETQALELFGIRLVGLNADNGKKLLFTLVFITALLWLGRLT